jgi:pimeloyl-ACP methyl ester carboxylesterase
MAVSSSVDEPVSYGPSGRSAWLDVDWREHQRWVTVLGRRMNVIDLGSGPPLLFVHGLSGSWQNWLENVCAFAGDHRVIAVDLPGFGESEMPAGKLSISGYADAVDSLCAALGVDAAAVVGNSMGGFVGAELAIRHPQRVERLVLVAAAGISVQHMRNDPALAAMRRAERLLALYGAWFASRSDAVARRPRLRRMVLGLVAAHPERLPAPLVAEQVRGSGKPGFVGAIDAMTSYPLRERLGEIACPTLVVWGDRDRLVPLRDADEFVRLIADARKVVYADTGHVPMLERPDRFNADLREFLEEEPEPGGPT